MKDTITMQAKKVATNWPSPNLLLSVLHMRYHFTTAQELGKDKQIQSKYILLVFFVLF